ncbi:MAG: hypothetical protein AB1649_17375 [Chloroflexota bacterium]
MRINPSVRNLVLIWMGWALTMIAFQETVGMRLDLQRPDRALSWTAGETAAGSQDDQPYLIDPFMNQHVSWDSEFYLSVAVAGYDDPEVRGISTNTTPFAFRPMGCQPGLDGDCVSLSYAFFPLYPVATRLVALPLHPLQLTPIARATLAAIIVSLLGTLGAMLGLYFMSRESLGEAGGVRAAFYMLIFPSGFFLTQVYADGLFIGLIFGTLAFLLARKWGWAALLSALAVWTRPGGAIIALPLAIVWLMDRPWQDGWKSALMRGLAALAPILSHSIWTLTPLADKFQFVEDRFFGRGLLVLSRSLDSWQQALLAISSGNTQAKFYYTLEFGAIALAILACLLLLRERPEISLFGLAMVLFAVTSGPFQGMIRYVLAAPPLFWILARWGKNPAFDRVWSVVSILLLGMEAMLFSFDLWVA